MVLQIQMVHLPSPPAARLSIVAARDPPAQALRAALTRVLCREMSRVSTAAAASPRSHRAPEYRPSSRARGLVKSTRMADRVEQAARAAPRSHREPEYRPSHSRKPTSEPKPSRRVQGVQKAL
jgi:hypothetical protein